MNGSTGSGIGKLRWRCRRGTKELDLLLERFLHRGYEALDEEQKACFERLLATPDPQLQAWLSGVERPSDPLLENLVQRILSTTAH